MLQRLLCLCTALIVLLSGCGETGSAGAVRLAEEIRAELTEMTHLSGRAEVTADYGERVYSFVLDLAYDAETGGVLTVVEPEIIAGVTARVTPDGATLQYDGSSLETGPILGTGTSPVAAMPLFLSWARTGYISECAFEQLGEIAALRVVCTEPSTDAGSGIRMDFWFDRDTHVPLRAELSSDGVLVIAAVFSNIVL